jgi:hypothetical protein
LIRTSIRWYRLAYIVSAPPLPPRSRDLWLKSFTLPNQTHYSTLIISLYGSQRGNYILVLKGDFYSYVLSFLASAADAETTARALTDWFSTFGVCRNCVRDRDSHFKNEVVRILKEQNHCAHRFTLAYSLWGNGIVEVVNREILRLLRALSSEFQNPVPRVAKLVAGGAESPKFRLFAEVGKLAALTTMSGLAADSPLASITLSKDARPIYANMGELRSKQVGTFEATLEALDKMHIDKAGKTSSARQGRSTLTTPRSTGSLAISVVVTLLCEEGSHDTSI